MIHTHAHTHTHTHTHIYIYIYNGFCVLVSFSYGVWVLRRQALVVNGERLTHQRYK